MSAELVRGGNVALPAGTERVLVTIGWRHGDVAGHPLEVDAQAVALDARGRVAAPDRLAFFSELATAGGAHPVPDGDEAVVVDLTAVPADVDRVAFALAVFRGGERGQSFADVPDVHVQVDVDGGAEVARYRLDDRAANTAVVLGELYRHVPSPTGWKFRAVGQGYAGGLAALAREVGAVG